MCKKIIRKIDRFRIHVEELSENFKCKYYYKVYSGDVARLKSHLSQILRRDIEICNKIPPDVQTEIFTSIGGDSNKKN